MTSIFEGTHPPKTRPKFQSKHGKVADLSPKNIFRNNPPQMVPSRIQILVKHQGLAALNQGQIMPTLNGDPIFLGGGVSNLMLTFLYGNFCMGFPENDGAIFGIG